MLKLYKKIVVPALLFGCENWTLLKKQERRTETAEKKFWNSAAGCTGLFISPSGISELDCATTKTDTAERSISIGRESLQVFFVLGALAYFEILRLGGSREEKWRSQ